MLQKKKKKKQPDEQCKLEDNLNELSDIPEFGPVLSDTDSKVPVESILGTSSGFKSQYNSIANKQAASSIRKLADGSMKIGDKNVKKIRGMKKVYEAKTKDTRVYFQMDGEIVQIILPALKTDQKQSIRLLKKYFK